MNINLNRRCFLKKTLISFFFIIFFFNKENFFNSKRRNIKDLELLKNFYFAKKKYHKETTSIIFKNFINDNKSMKTILYNIEKRRRLSNFKYKENIKFLT